MSLFRLTLQNLLHRRFLSLLTVCAVAVTVAFIVLLSLSRQSVEQGAKKGYGPFDLVIGAAGSETQLVLNTFYHIGAPTGNIPLAVLHQVEQDQEVDTAFAMTTGDQHQGFPIVGIDSGYFVTRYGDRNLKEGALYKHTGETIIGSYVAESLGLHIGDTFTGSHGLVQGDIYATVEVKHEEDEKEHTAGAAGNSTKAEHGEEYAHESFRYTVSGILPALHTPDDRAIFTTIDYAWAVHGLTPEEREITAVLVKPASLLGAHELRQALDGRNGVQAAYTSQAVSDVLNAVDQGAQLLGVLTALCVILAAITILLSLIAAAGERTKDVGLLRLLGKSRTYVWLTLTGEGLLVTTAGLVAGMLLGHLSAYLVKDVLFARAGIQLEPYQWMPDHWLIAGGALSIGLLSSLGPAFRMYRMHPLALFKS